MARTPHETIIATPKPDGVYRIFLFGESAAYGDPEPDFGLARMLTVLLEARFPGTRFEVINAAVTAINSHVVRGIGASSLARELDLWLLYMGNNEVIGPYGAGTVFGRQVPPFGVIRASIPSRRHVSGSSFAGASRVPVVISRASFGKV